MLFFIYFFHSKAQDEHMGSLTRQLLTRMNVPQKWADTLRNIMRKVSQLVKPDVRNEGDSMDIRQYVQVKKVRLFNVLVCHCTNEM